MTDNTVYFAVSSKSRDNFYLQGKTYLPSNLTELAKQVPQLLPYPYSQSKNYAADVNKNYAKECYIEFCRIYADKPFKVPQGPVGSLNIKDVFPKWCIELLSKLEPDEVIELMKIAHKEGNNVVVDVACIELSVVIKGKSPEGIRNIIRLSNTEDIV